ncbi:MAG: AMP-binding protein [Candidatus Lokiarchaeota archaeon]|nr:AMP-binding protein [Candidatus Lokiarchaeota archaeon]
MKTGEGRITERTSGNRGYKSTWVYIPSDISKDESFPFNNKEKVIIELKNNKLIIHKIHDVKEITTNYGISDATLCQLIETAAEKNNEKPLLYYHDRIYSYEEVNDAANKVANGFIEFIKEREINNPNVAILFPNHPELIFTWLGLAKTKCVSIPVSFTLEGDLLEYLLRNSKTAVLLIDYRYYKRFKEIENELSKIKYVFVRNSPDGFKFDKKTSSFEDIISSNTSNPDIKIKSSDPLEIMYTAGTTGKPKGVLYRNYYTLSGISVGSKLKKFGFNNPNHKIYCPLPLFQSFIKYFVFIPALYFNSSVVITDKFDTDLFWKEVSKYKPDGFCYYGAYFLDLMNQEPKVSDRKHSLKYAFGFEAFKKVWEAFERRFNIHIIEGWSLVEGIGYTINDIGSKGGKIGSIGIPAKGYEVKICDSEGNVLPPGRSNIGELVSRTKLPIELEYYNLEEKTSATIGEDRWVSTGDFGYKDSDGFFYYLGRKSDMIKRGNEVFFALDIERVANSHPLIINSAVIEVQFANSSKKELKICCKIKDNTKLAHHDFYSFLKENLAYFMVPRFIEFRSILPKNANEFVQKFILKQEWELKERRKNTYDTRKGGFLS